MEIPCSVGTVLTAEDVEGLRFCTSILGGLDMTVANAVADFTAVYDIKKIGGMDQCGFMVFFVELFLDTLYTL